MFSCAEMVSQASRILTLVKAFDDVASDQVALDIAQDKFQDLLQV